METITVLLADDYLAVRGGLRVALGQVSGLTVIGETCTIRETLDHVTRERPTVAVVGVLLSDGSGAEVCRGIDRARALLWRRVRVVGQARMKGVNFSTTMAQAQAGFSDSPILRSN
ncbi:MAG: hypothetical protein M1570_08525 [Chloroflexi bacterium]|nr:hypothetical protein [Chloroflexota bacterium]